METSQIKDLSRAIHETQAQHITFSAEGHIENGRV
jgi:hypothetical protein